MFFKAINSGAWVPLRVDGQPVVQAIAELCVHRRSCDDALQKYGPCREMRYNGAYPAVPEVGEGNVAKAFLPLHVN
jgi:hypothetical protein